ncbi:hypothetical protein ACVWZZ_005794 [Bradyrhizobium sp. LM6.10]
MGRFLPDLAGHSFGSGPFFGVPSMFDSLEVEVLYPA